MRQLLLPMMLTSSLLAEFDVKGFVALDSQVYLTHPAQKHGQNFTLQQQLEMTYSEGDFEVVSLLNAQLDSYDFFGNEENKRTFIRLDELYGKYNLENDMVTLGRNVRFWGALEVRNIVDGFNPEDLRNDPFETDKMGVMNAQYSHYTESGEFSVIVKFEERDQKMADFPYVYYFFPLFVHYEDTLQSESSRYRPTLYVSYSGSTDTEYAVDYALILQHGYDSQRYYRADDPLVGTPVNFQQHAYLVNKVSTYNTMVVADTLLKVEALYADVIDDPNISDYLHLGLGVEHTLTQLVGEADLGLIAEYYYYDTFESAKYTDLELFEIFQNDLFIGGRYSFNDSDSSSIIGGAVLDLDYNEQSYYVEYETRMADVLKVHFDYRYIEPSKDALTAFHLLGRHQRVGLNLVYYF